MKTFKLFFFLLLTYFDLSAQTWNVAIPYETADHLNVAKKLIKTQDDGFLVLLQEFLDDNSGFRKMTHSMLKYASNGELLWEKHYDFGVSEPIPNNDWGGAIPRDVIQLGNGNFFMTGAYYDIDTSFRYFFLTDENGDSLSFKETIPILDLNYVDNRIFARTGDSSNDSFIELNNMGEIIYQTSPAEHSIWNMRIDQNLNIFIARGISETIIKKISIDGSVLEENTFIDIGSLLTLNNTGGVTSYERGLIKLDENLNEIWSIPIEEIFSNGDLYYYDGTDIIHTSDNGYVIVGSYCFDPFFPCSVYIIKFDQDGNREWGGLYGGNYLPLEHIQNIVEVDGGYVFLGTNSFTEKIWLVKVNTQGVFTGTEDIKPNNPSFTTLYPNPAKDVINLEFQKTFSGFIRIWNLTGQLVYEERIASVNRFDHFVGTFPAGYYMVQLTDKEQGSFSIPFIKSR